MQQQKLNVVNSIQLKGVSSRYMTSRIYHKEQKKCYIFVGTNLMIYFIAVIKEGTEETKAQDQQAYKLQEFKKIDQTDYVFTCLSTMIYLNDVLVITGFVNKQTLYSSLCVYSSNANVVYQNGNIFGESKINIINVKQKQYSKVQLLFTTSSDNAVRMFRLCESNSKKFVFELQLIHIFKFDEVIIDFDMKCILSEEFCIRSDELSTNRVSVGNFDEGIYVHEYYKTNQDENNSKIKESSKDQEQQSLNEQKQVDLSKLSKGESKDVSPTNSINFHNFTTGHESMNQFVPLNLPHSKNSQLSANNLDQRISNCELDFEEEELPQLKQMKRTHTTDGQKQHSQNSSQSRKLAMRSVVFRNEGAQDQEETSQNSNEEFILQRKSFKRESSHKAQTLIFPHLTGGESIRLQVSKDDESGTHQMSQGKLQSNQKIKKQLSQTIQILKPDDMYLSFADLDGLVIVKQFKVNPQGIDLSGSLANEVTSYRIDLGISASYCRFLKCTENIQNSLNEKQQLSKKQQRKQVKFQNGLRQKQHLSQSTTSVDQDEEEIKVKKDDNAPAEQGKGKPLREVNLNLIVANLMGDVIEFKNVPLQGLENPVAFPSVDNYNSGVTGLCVKSQDSLEILVSYFDGSVYFFDLNYEDKWNLKLSQPLNSNHFGVYYENTQDSDVVFLLSDDTIQIYELNNYHIN